MLADYHVHTNFSDDSSYEMEQVVLDAIAMGVSELCFTDHVDYGIKVDWDSGLPVPVINGLQLTNVNYPLYIKEINALKAKYKDKITLKTGLEFGIQKEYIKQYEDLFHRYDFDFILLSIHQIHNQEFWTNDFQRGKTQEEYTRAYYKEMYDLVHLYHDYSVLAHMDLIARYDGDNPYPFKYLKDDIAEILKYVIADGKGIELNTSSFYYGLKDLTPSRDILKLYHNLGGTIITIGSDSHKPVQLAAKIPYCKQELLKLGYKQYCTYEKMTPVFHDLKD